MSLGTQNVADYLLEGKEQSRVALIGLERSWTYGDIAASTASVVRCLDAAGTTKGDRVVLAAENSLFWVAIYLGTLRAGLVCVPIPPASSVEDIAYIVEQTEAKVIFVQSRYVPKFLGHRIPVVTDSEIPGHPEVQSLQQFTNSEQAISAPVAGADDLACLMFTSGSTGKPRGVMVSHGNIRANTESIIEYLELISNDRIMTVLPFHYCFGTSLLHTHLRVGGSLVLDHRFMYPDKVLQRMQDTRCTGFAGVPSHYQVLLRRTSLRKMSFPDLRSVQQAGGHLAAPFVRELQDALPKTKIFVMYGQTEATARLSYLPPEFLNTKLGSIGKGMPGVKLTVLDEAGQPVAPGQVGEIVAEGANIAKGYWKSADASREVFRDSKLYTGDNAVVDEDGFISIVGRTRDFIKCGGTRTSCKQIEDLLLENKDVIEAAVLAMSDEKLGEAVRAFVVPCSSVDFDLKAFTEFCRATLPFNLVPRDVVVMKTLPKNQAGKILKQELQKFAANSIQASTE